MHSLLLIGMFLAQIPSETAETDVSPVIEWQVTWTHTSNQVQTVYPWTEESQRVDSPEGSGGPTCVGVPSTHGLILRGTSSVIPDSAFEYRLRCSSDRKDPVVAPDSEGTRAVCVLYPGSQELTKDEDIPLAIGVFQNGVWSREDIATVSCRLNTEKTKAREQENIRLLEWKKNDVEKEQARRQRATQARVEKEAQEALCTNNATTKVTCCKPDNSCHFTN